MMRFEAYGGSSAGSMMQGKDGGNAQTEKWFAVQICVPFFIVLETRIIEPAEEP